MNTQDALTRLTQAADYDPTSMPVEKARAFIWQTLTPCCGEEVVPLKNAVGRTLSRDVVSPLNVPGHDNSAMDGYAFRFADVVANGETRLTRIGESFAGHPFDGTVGKGQCVRIFTGAVIPDGCDTVVPQEKVEEKLGVLIIGANVVKREGDNRRQAGEDIAVGDTVFSGGQKLNAPEIGMLASLGLGEVPVFRKLRVAFFSNGDELTPAGQPLLPGKIYDSNRFMIHAALCELGVDAIDMGCIPDDPDAIENALLSAADSADVVLTIGGVSVGDADFVKASLDRNGKVLFWRLAMKPGRPLAYGMIRNAHFFGLPGNPVSAIVTFRQFVRDALLVLQGQSTGERILVPAVLKAPVKKAPGRMEFQRGFCETVNGVVVVTPAPAQGSGILSSMSRANCFIVLPMDCGNLDAEAAVMVELF
jgi:molybdopterin molybdotransferase